MYYKWLIRCRFHTVIYKSTYFHTIFFTGLYGDIISTLFLVISEFNFLHSVVLISSPCLLNFPQAKTSLNISPHTLCWRGQQLATCNKAYVWRSISFTLLLIGSFRYRAFTSRIKPFTICFVEFRIFLIFSVTGAPDVCTTIRGNYVLNFYVGFVVRVKEVIPWTLPNLLRSHTLLRNLLSWQWLIKCK